MNCSEESYCEVFKTQKENGTLTWLSSDSPNVLPPANEIKENGANLVYVIGGLVDHNFHKGLTLGLAEKRMVKHARLPIDEHIKMAMSRVLAVNHVFEIMLYASNGTPWDEAFVKVIPQRKIATDPPTTT